MLLADEPTGNMDSQTGETIIALLRRMHREEGATMILVTHDPEIAKAAERIVQLRDGRVDQDRLVEPAPRKAAG